jgi:hypothetical protein
MQLTDLIKPLDSMTEEELREHLRNIRHNRTKAKPATVNREKRAAKKGATGRISKVDDLFGGLTDEEKAELIKQLGG